MDFKLLVIVLAEQRKEVLPDDVPAQIGRDITDFRSPVGRAVGVVRPDEVFQRLGVAFAPSPLLPG